MADFVFVKVLDSSQDLVEKTTSFLIREPLFLNDIVEEFAAWSVLHNQKKLATRFDDFKKLNDVRMSHDLNDLNLAHDPRDIGLFFYLVFLKYFDRYLFLCKHMRSQPDFSESALANSLA